jgi:calcineurin-like phosphoesterase family protein
MSGITYVVSDTHFDGKMSPSRNGKERNHEWQYENPEYVEDLIHNWKSVVSDKDVVIHIGDVMGGRFTTSWSTKIQELPGYKILVRGNHDQARREKWLKCFQEVHDYHYVRGKVIYCHQPVDPALFGCNYNLHGHLHEHPKDLNDRIIRSYRKFYSFNKNYGFVLSEWNWSLAKEEDILKRAFGDI